MRELRKKLTSSRLVTSYLMRVFETEVGVKYQLGRFDSIRFRDHVVEEISFGATDLASSDLLLGPDYLRNCHTLCGRTILRSPHYALIAEIEEGRLTATSEYMQRCRTGTIDARAGHHPTLKFLMQKHRLRKDELFADQRMEIYVSVVTFRGKPVYVIADGKHRAALAAYYNRMESVHLRVISNEVFQVPFFRRMDIFTLTCSSQEYSVNQEMIEARRNGE